MSSRPSRGAARLAAILDALPDGLVLVNCNGTVVNANTIALGMFETPGTALVGRGLLDLLPDFDSRLIPGSMRRPEGTDDRGRTRPTRMMARRTDGSEFPVEVTSASLEDGREAYDSYSGYTGDELLMLVVRDLTGTLDTEAELARSQRQTEMILRAASEGVVGTDTDGRVVLVNPAFAQILGYRAGELGGAELHQLILPKRPDGEPFPYEESPLADTLRSGRKHRVRGQVLWAKNGDRVPVDLTTAPVRDGDQLVGAVMTFTDRRPYEQQAEAHATELAELTDRHTAELAELSERHAAELADRTEKLTAELERQKERYETELAERKQRLAALTARHEQLTAVLDESLRGPLDELRAELSTLAADDAGQLWPEANQVLHHLAAGYARMTTLVDNVLGYQRLDAGAEELDKHVVLLDAVVTAGIDGSVELIGPGRAQFAVHAPPIEAEVDPARLTTALSHLVADVAGVDATGKSKAAQSGGYTDSTIVVAAAQRGDVVRIEVRGPYAGGDPVHQPVVRGIVAAHGGVVQTHEVPGTTGGAYVVEVPLGAGRGTVTPPPAPAPATSGPEAGAQFALEPAGAGRALPAPGPDALDHHTQGGHPQDVTAETGHTQGSLALPAHAQGGHSVGGNPQVGHGQDGHALPGQGQVGHSLGGHALPAHAPDGHSLGGSAQVGHGQEGHSLGGNAHVGHGQEGHSQVGHGQDGHSLGGHGLGGHGLGGHAPAGSGAQVDPAQADASQVDPAQVAGSAIPSAPVGPSAVDPAAGLSLPADAAAAAQARPAPGRPVPPQSAVPQPVSPQSVSPQPAVQQPVVPQPVVPQPASGAGDGPALPAQASHADASFGGVALGGANGTHGGGRRRARRAASTDAFLASPLAPEGGPVPEPTGRRRGRTDATPSTGAPGAPAELIPAQSAGAGAPTGTGRRRGRPAEGSVVTAAESAQGRPALGLGDTVPPQGVPVEAAGPALAPASAPALPAVASEEAPASQPTGRRRRALAAAQERAAAAEAGPRTPFALPPADADRDHEERHEAVRALPEDEHTPPQPRPLPTPPVAPAPAPTTSGTGTGSVPLPPEVPIGRGPAPAPAAVASATAPAPAPAPAPAAAPAPAPKEGAQGRAFSVRTLGQGVPFVQPPAAATPPGGTAVAPSGRRRKLGNPAEEGRPALPETVGKAHPQQEARPQAPTAAPTAAPVSSPSPTVSPAPSPSPALSHPLPGPTQVPAAPKLGPTLAPTPAPEGRAYAIGAPAEGSAEGPEPLDGPGGAVEVSNQPLPQPVDDELPPEPLDNPRRLLVWPAPDVATQQALSDRGYRPVIVHSREEVDAQIAAFPAALFVDPLTGPITRTALQSLRQAAVAAEVPVLLAAGLGQATREAAYGADPAVLLKALAPRDSEQHPSRVLLIEEHDDIARALAATLERRGMVVARAATDTEAVTLAQQIRPNLVVMDLMQVRRRRAGIIDWLRANGQLNRTPLVVYTSADLDEAELPTLASGETVLFLAERSTSTEVQARIVDLLAKIGTN
ncbi:PAS domain-containing protein [Streptomyces sp. NPDC053431]|uniref:PAS domain-containing protein n=1 Tax=Streptomyces sp. NPDC053431 TaxID=3365703 RepID=UPI0037D18812